MSKMKFIILLILMTSLVYANNNCDLCKFGVSLFESELDKNKPVIIQKVNATCMDFQPVKSCYEVCKITDELIQFIVSIPVDTACSFFCSTLKQ